MKEAWKQKTIGEVTYISDFVANGSFATLRENVTYLDNEDYAILVRLADFSNNWTGPFKYVNEHAYEFLSKSKLSEGDIVMCNVGSIGKCFNVVDLGKPMTLAPNSILIRTITNDLEQSFLFYYVKTPQFQALIDSISHSAAQPKFNKTDFKKLEIKFPSQTEQLRIVDKLDRMFTHLDALSQNTQRAIDNAKQLFQSKIQEAMTQKKWKEEALGDICEILDSKRIPITKNDRTEGSIPYYGATGIQDYVADYIFNEDLVLLGEDGAKWGAGDNSAYKISGKAWVNNHAHVLRPNRKIILDNWLIYYLNYSDLSGYITGVTVPKLNQKKMSSISIPIPTLNEQQQIVAELDDISAKIAELEANFTRQQTLLTELRNSALHEAFEGNL